MLLAANHNEDFWINKVQKIFYIFDLNGDKLYGAFNFYFSRGFYFYNKSADYLGEFQTYPVLDWIHD